VPTAVQRVANVERAQMLIEAQSRPVLQHLLHHAQALWLDTARAHRRHGLIRWAVDVDPLAI
jgi:primosomal protein N' (replication factor Y)